VVRGEPARLFHLPAGLSSPISASIPPFERKWDLKKNEGKKKQFQRLHSNAWHSSLERKKKGGLLGWREVAFPLIG